MKLPREQISNNVAEILETLIVKGTGMFPRVKPNAAEIVERVNTLTYYQLRLREPIDFFDPQVDVKVLDKTAKEQTRRSQVVAVTAGVSTGLFGLPGLAVDLPVLVANTVGLVRRHALTYGFTTIEDSTNDPTPLLLALGASVGADMVIDRVGIKVGETVGLDLGTKIVEKYLVKRVSEQFAARLLTSWLPRMVPIIGTATIAALDTAFLTLAGRESSRYFRQRHMDVRKYIAGTNIERAKWAAIAAGATMNLPGVEPPVLPPPQK
jgi:EcsC protein family